MLLPIELQKGLYKNGTDYQSKGRWIDSNLVRFNDNTIKPINGWREKSSSSVDDVVRGAVAWKDNSNDQWIAAGTASKLYVYTGAGIQSDITPTGLLVGYSDALFPDGFGKGFYGSSYFGIERPQLASPSPATTWSLDTFGQFLVACSSHDGKVYEWQLSTGTRASQISNAPTNNEAIIVTAERFLFCLGANGNPKLIKWADRESLTVWDPLATNEAGDIELQTTGEIMCGAKVQGQTLILTTNDAHIATYQGAPFVYGFERVGSSCGIISKNAVSSIDQGAVWMGASQFHIYTGGTVQNLPCEVSDYVFKDMNKSQASKIYSMNVSKHSEVWWFYPSKDSTENNRYVVFNHKENCWYVGSISRTAGVDAGAFNHPMVFNPSGKLYEHEVGYNYDGQTPYLESGPIEIGAGDNVVSVTEMIPDEVTQGDVYVEFFTKFYPNGDEYSHGSYNMSNPTSLRFTGRQFKMRITANANTDWRIGINRLKVIQGGRR